jgi:hypothetical protein
MDIDISTYLHLFWWTAGLRFPVGGRHFSLLHGVQTGSERPPSHLWNEYWWALSPGVKLTIQLHLLLRSRMLVFLHSQCLHGVVLNYLMTETTILFYLHIMEWTLKNIISKIIQMFLSLHLETKHTKNVVNWKMVER